MIKWTNKNTGNKSRESRDFETLLLKIEFLKIDFLNIVTTDLRIKSTHTGTLLLPPPRRSPASRLSLLLSSTPRPPSARVETREFDFASALAARDRAQRCRTSSRPCVLVTWSGSKVKRCPVCMLMSPMVTVAVRDTPAITRLRV